MKPTSVITLFAIVLLGTQLTSCAGMPENGAAITPFPANGAAVAKAQRPASAHPANTTFCCLYVSESAGTNLLEYARANDDGHISGGPVCTLNGITAQSIRTDAKNELIVPTASAVNIYQEHKGTCLPSAPEKQIAIPNGVDGFSADGRKYYIAVKDYHRTTQSAIVVCKFGRRPGCSKRVLQNIAAYTIWGVTVDQYGGVYASGTDLTGTTTSIVYWAAGQGSGTVLSGIKNAGPGGIYFDTFGYMAAIDSSPIYSGNTALWVYSGCPSACSASGPFPLGGSNIYGTFAFGLNGAEQFMTVQPAIGEIDVYAFNGPSGLSFEYSDSSGLNGSSYPTGIAVYPH